MDDSVPEQRKVLATILQETISQDEAFEKCVMGFFNSMAKGAF
jgi:hypothetical protein